VLRDLGRLLLIAAGAAVLTAGYATFRVWQQGETDEQRPADAIVVLGAAQYDGRPSPVFAARLEHAVELYQAGVANLLVVTGGKQDGDRTTEAAAARRFAIDRGIPAESILVEDAGRTTIESLRTVGEIFRDRGLRTAVFVSDRTHMLRVLRIAHDQGIAAYGSPTRTSPTDRGLGPRVDATIHELGALALYFIAGDRAPAQLDVGAAATLPPTAD
jgi:uncharacterized SAM-binding protein YcdF (DUF218 family)